MSGGQGQGPLRGIKVLDLTSVLMGPYATQIFADLGADVIKLEGPSGDTTRHLPPATEPGRGAMFVNLNRGKRSIALDLKAARDGAIFARLVERADVFVHNLAPGAVERLGFGYDALAARHPRLIWCAISGATLWTMQSPEAMVVPMAAALALAVAGWKSLARARQASRERT